MIYLKNNGIRCEIHLSGETAEVNSRMIDVFDRLDVSRLIFHRKNSFADMESVIRHEKEKGSRGVYEFEAFALNELCQFSGAFCNSLHCDEMGYLCRVPYRLEPEERRERAEDRSTSEQLPWAEDGYLCGATGCGLCALYRLREAGITHLKLVGLGNYADYMERDICNLKRALTLLEESGSEADYREKMKRELFPKGCSGNCYYRE